MEKKQLPVELSQREISWGLHYLLMQFLIIGLLVVNYATNFVGKIISSVVYAVQSGILFVILPLFGMR